MSFPGAENTVLPGSGGGVGSASPDILSAFAAARSAQAQQQRNMNALQSNDAATPAAAATPGRNNVWNRLAAKICCKCNNSNLFWRNRSTYCNRFLHRPWWRGLTGFFSIVLLFGNQIQHLWVTPKADIVFDILYIITLIFFVVDICIRTQADESYFVCQVCCVRGAGLGGTGEPLGSTCILGSFMFWCDVVSTATLLYNIELINKARFESPEINIELNNSGIPISGFEDFNRLRPVELELNLLVTIARTSRVARFVRSRIVVTTSSKINWYWFFHNCHRFNPLWYWKTCSERRRQAQSMGVDGGDSGTFSTPKHQADNQKRDSWGILQIGVLAAVKAQAEAEAREAKQFSSRNLGLRPAFESMKRSLRNIGLMQDERLQMRKHLAATKIQRAWKAHIKFDPHMSHDGSQYSDLEGDVAWQGRGGAVSERGVTKRSFILNSNDNLGTGADPGGKRKRRGRGESRFQSSAGRGGLESQVGSDMRELTGQRVAIGVLLALICTVIFTYNEADTTRPTAMIVLHTQTTIDDIYSLDAISAARSTSTPDLLQYEVDDEVIFQKYRLREIKEKLRDREKLTITVTDSMEQQTIGLFAYRRERIQCAWVEFVTTVFVVMVWFCGVTAFTGPVMSLVVIPIERMVRLLGMLMLDPLGYQSTARFKKFLIEEDEIIKNTRWTKEVLKGMETSFLMSTILRIGSLMKVGFGSAGVEIIRNNLQRGGKDKNMLVLNSQGSTVSCIFLFCDIRQFTDATECLQEEVFVFTNRIAAVVHSICHSYGGAANKNVGDAFLLSWILNDDKSDDSGGGFGGSMSGGGDSFKAKNNQGDKALLSVIKICIALYYDSYYLEAMSEAARTRLQNKLKKRAGPVVQMGFGLHAGKAVQGAIGSQRKIDATYVSEAVERAEFLESSTKKYGLKMLMSDNFHRLLHQNTRRRCRKVDQILLKDDEDDDEEDDDLEGPNGEIMELFTFDMDVDAIRKPPSSAKKIGDNSDAMSDCESVSGRKLGRMERRREGSARQVRRRRSVVKLGALGGGSSEELKPPGSVISLADAAGLSSPSIGAQSVSSIPSDKEESGTNFHSHDLVLPTGPALYSHNVWQTPDMKRIRDKFVQGLFFQKFNSGLQSFYKKDWDNAKQCFQTILDNFEDGPSLYFMKQIKKHDGKPPKDFLGYGIA